MAENIVQGEITDPKLLSMLNGGVEVGQEVTDPSILSSLNVDSFDRLLKIESGNKQFSKDGKVITSKKGAIGAAQVMPGTAPEAALLAGVPFDEKLYKTDKDYNIKLGKAYFGKQLENFNGDFFKAAAAYNAGAKKVTNALLLSEKTGKDWTYFIPNETKNYVKNLGYGSDKALEMLPQEAQDFIMNDSNLTDEQRQQKLEGTVQKASEVGETYVFDPAVVKGAGLIGSVVGGGLAKIAGRGLSGIVGSSVGGGASGVGSSIASQYYLEGKPVNFENDITGIGIELAAGGLPTIVREIGSRGPIAAIEKIPGIGAESAKVLKWMTGGDTEAQWALKRFTVGDPRRKGGVATDVFTKGSQDEQRKIATSLGLTIPKDVPVEKGLRTVYEEAVDNLRKTGQFFSDSPQFAQVSSNLNEAVNARLITKQQQRIIEDVLKSDKSKVISSKGFASRIDNLIHNQDQIQGLSEFTPEGKTFVRDLLKSNYDDFFSQKTGVNLFGVLKNAEQAAIVATARDSIPALLDKGFKGSSDDLAQALRNIKKSPNGAQDFKTAVVSYFNSLPDGKVAAEFDRLKGPMLSSKIIKVDDIRKLEKGVGKRTSTLAKVGTAAGVTAKDAILGFLGAEGERRDILEPFNL